MGDVQYCVVDFRPTVTRAAYRAEEKKLETQEARLHAVALHAHYGPVYASESCQASVDTNGGILTAALPIGVTPCATPFNGTQARIAITIPKAQTSSPATVVHAPLLQGYVTSSGHLQQQVVERVKKTEGNVVAPAATAAGTSFIRFVDVTCVTVQDNAMLREIRSGTLLTPQTLICRYVLARSGNNNNNNRNGKKSHAAAAASGILTKKRRIIVISDAEAEEAYELLTVSLRRQPV